MDNSAFDVISAFHSQQHCWLKELKEEETAIEKKVWTEGRFVAA